MSIKLEKFGRTDRSLNAQSSLSIFAQNYLCKCKDTYFILQSNYLRIYKVSFEAKILFRDDCPRRMFNLLIILPFFSDISCFCIFAVLCVQKKAEKGRFHTALFFVGVTFGKIGHHSPASCSCAAFVVYAKVKGSPDSVVDCPPFLVLLFLFLIRSFLSLL